MKALSNDERDVCLHYHILYSSQTKRICNNEAICWNVGMRNSYWCIVVVHNLHNLQFYNAITKAINLVCNFG